MERTGWKIRICCDAFGIERRLSGPKSFIAVTCAKTFRIFGAVGIDVLTAQDDGAEEFDDIDLFDRAAGLGRVVFTRDRDFLVEAVRR